MSVLIVIAILCADIATTWILLARYRRRVREDGAAGKLLLRFGFHGQFAFVAVRIVLLALLVVPGGTWAAVGWIVVTGYAVINNLIVMSKLKS